MEINEEQTELIKWLIIDMKGIINDQFRVGNPLVRINRVGTSVHEYYDKLTELYKELEAKEIEERRKNQK